MKKLSMLVVMVFFINFMFSVGAIAVTEKYSYETEALKLRTMGLYKGLSATSWKPDLGSKLDRQTGVVMLLRVYGLETEANKADLTLAKSELKKKFTDAKSIGDWAAKQVYFAVNRGIVNGFADGKFKPNDYITGRQYCKLVLSMLGYEGFKYEDSGALFHDVAKTNDGEELIFGQDVSIKKEILIGISYKSLAAKFSKSDSNTLKSLVSMGIVKKTAVPTDLTSITDGIVQGGVSDVYSLMPWLKQITSNTTATASPTSTPVPATLTIIKVEPVAVRQVKVTFSKSVTNPQNVMFELYGIQVIPSTTSWNESKTEAILNMTNDIVLGNYSVKISGVILEDNKYAFSFIGQNNIISKFEFKNNILSKSSNYGLSLNYDLYTYYKAYDIYGNDITNSMLSTQINVSSNRGLKYYPEFGFTLQPQTNTMILHFLSNIPDTTKDIQVTVQNPVTSQVFANNIFSIGEATKATSIKMKDITYPYGVSKLGTGLQIAGYIPLDIKDQYGNVYSSAAGFNNDVAVIVDDTRLTVTVEEYVNTENNTNSLRLVLNTSKIADNKDISVFLIIKNNGISLSKKVSFIGDARANTITFGAPKAMVAYGDSAESLVIPINATDNVGNVLSQDEVVRQFELGYISQIWASGTAVTIARNGPNKGCIVNTTDILIKGNISVSLYANNIPYTTSVTILDEAYPARAEIVNAQNLNMISGTNKKIGVKFIDQYGRAFSDNRILTNVNAGNTIVRMDLTNGMVASITSKLADNIIGLNYRVGEGMNYTTEKTAGIKTIYSRAKYLVGSDALLVAANSNSIQSISQLELRVYKGNSPNSSNLTDFKEISVLSSKISVIPNLLSSYNYEVEDIPALWAPNDKDIAVSGADPYAKTIKVAAKFGNDSYSVPVDRILTVTAVDATNYISIAKIPATALINNQSESWIVAAKKSSETTLKQIKLSIIISVEGGTKEIFKYLTVTPEIRKTTKIVFARFVQNGLVTPEQAVDTLRNPFSLKVGAEEITSLYGLTSNILNEIFYVYEVDQYGVYKQIDNAKFDIGAIDKFNGSMYYSSNKLYFNKTQVGRNQQVPLIYTTLDGVLKANLFITCVDGDYTVIVDNTPPILSFSPPGTDRSIYVGVTESNGLSSYLNGQGQELAVGINYNYMFETTSLYSSITGAYWDNTNNRFLIFISEPLNEIQYIRVKPNLLGDRLGNKISSYVNLAKGKGALQNLVAP